MKTKNILILTLLIILTIIASVTYYITYRKIISSIYVEQMYNDIIVEKNEDWKYSHSKLTRLKEGDTIIKEVTLYNNGMYDYKIEFNTNKYTENMLNKYFKIEYPHKIKLKPGTTVKLTIKLTAKEDVKSMHTDADVYINNFIIVKAERLKD